jgi:hypothetical protein
LRIGRGGFLFVHNFILAKAEAKASDFSDQKSYNFKAMTPETREERKAAVNPLIQARRIVFNQMAHLPPYLRKVALEQNFRHLTPSPEPPEQEEESEKKSQCNIYLYMLHHSML